jgi:type II secretory pathway component PulM
MNRTLILAGLAVLAIAAGGYWQFVEVPARQAAAERAAAEAARAAEEAAAAEAARAAEEAAAAAARAAEEAAAEAASRAEGIAAALDPANLDPARIIDAIEASDLPAERKTFLTGIVRSAEGNAALLEAAAAQVREALGL